MKRFGMINVDNCEICNNLETVTHQLFDCTNASKLREFARIIDGTIIEDFYDLLNCTKNRTREVMKAAIIKCLIQIDRSKNITIDKFKDIVNHYKALERILELTAVRLSGKEF